MGIVILELKFEALLEAIERCEVQRASNVSSLLLAGWIICKPKGGLRPSLSRLKQREVV